MTSMMSYHLQGFPTCTPVPPGFYPAQERWCSCGCRSPVKFTSYCGTCGWPEDLCARRIDLVRTPLHQGHNEYTHCVYCPNLASRVLVPASGSPAADWESCLRVHTGIHTILTQAGAAQATNAVLRFMRLRTLHTWQQFLQHFDLYLEDYTAATFKDAPGHIQLFRLVFGHHAVAAAQQLLFRMPFQFHKYNPRFRGSMEFDEDWRPPASTVTDTHQIPFSTVMREINRIAIYFTERPAACIFEWAYLIELLLGSLARPLRRTLLLPSTLHTEQPFVDMQLVEQHILDECPDGDIYASAVPDSMLRKGSIILHENLIAFLAAQTAHDRAPHAAAGGHLPDIMVTVAAPNTPPFSPLPSIQE